MTHPMLQLPYPIHTSLAAQGLAWVENLSPTDAPMAHQYRVKVKRELKNRSVTHELLFQYDGEQYQLIEATNKLPLSIQRAFTWRLGIESFARTFFQKQVDA